MTIKDQFSPQEWAIIRRSPSVVSGLIATASPSGLIGLGKEMFAAARQLAQAKERPSGNALVEALIADISAKDESARDEAQAYAETLRGKQPDEVRPMLMDELRQLSQLLTEKVSAGESAGFKVWLLELGRSVASAAKEGGFLGFGGTTVTTEETAAIDSIAEALGMPAV